MIKTAHKFCYVKCVNITVLIMAIFATTSSHAAPPRTVTTLDAKTSNLLEFIGTLEAPGGYDSYSYYAAAPPPKPLTQMTIAEVLAWQDRIDARSKSEAAGRFQIMEDTLRPLVRNHGIDPKQLFDVNMQSRLAVILLKRRGWDPLSPNHIAVANSLAKEWAALPVVSGPNIGKSYYRNTKGARNRAQTTPAIFLDVLKNGSKVTAVLKAVKLSRSYRRVASIKNRSVTIESITRVKRVKTRKVKGGDITQSKVIVFNIDPFKLD